MAAIYAPKTKRTGLPGQEYSHERIRVENISVIMRADHVMFQRGGYEHHGIVTAVDAISGTFDCMEYHKRSREDGIKIQRKRHILSEEAGSVYIVQYEEGECLPADEVVRNAENMLDERNYNPLWNNCESFTHQCKVGIAKTEQVENIFSFGLLEVFPMISENIGEAERDELIEKLLQNPDWEEWLNDFIKTFSGSTWFSIAIAIETVISLYKVSKFVRQNMTGKITGKRCIAMIIQQIVVQAGESVCAYGLCGIGGLVGWPLLGGFLGGVVGRWTVMWLSDKVLAWM